MRTIPWLPLLLVAACGSSSDGPDGSVGPCDGPEYLEWDGMTLMGEVSSADPEFCDPLYRFSDTGLFSIEVRWNHVDDLLYDETLVIAAGALTTSGEGEVGVDYALGPMPEDPDLETSLVVRGTGGTCRASAGRVTLSALPASGLVEGTYEVTEWSAESAATCPAVPVSGAFGVLRD